MPPPSPDLTAFLHKSRTVAQVAGIIIGGCWILLAAWAAFTDAEWLGPLRALTAFALAVGSTVCAAIWWATALVQRIRLDQLTAAAADHIPGQPTVARPRLLDTGTR